jgi:hypothetical protein
MAKPVATGCLSWYWSLAPGRRNEQTGDCVPAFLFRRVLAYRLKWLALSRSNGNVPDEWVFGCQGAAFLEKRKKVRILVLTFFHTQMPKV